MTTLAVGLDIVTTTTFEHQLADAASGFVDATFTAREQRAAQPDGAIRTQRLAARFAAKEAFVKAWSGARAGREPQLACVDLREIEVVDDGHGRPSLRLHGAVADALDELSVELGATLRAHLSLSHDPPTAEAVVVLEARDMSRESQAARFPRNFPTMHPTGPPVCELDRLTAGVVQRSLVGLRG